MFTQILYPSLCSTYSDEVQHNDAYMAEASQTSSQHLVLEFSWRTSRSATRFTEYD